MFNLHQEKRQDDITNIETSQENGFRLLRQQLHDRLIDNLDFNGSQSLKNIGAVNDQINVLIDDISYFRGKAFSSQDKQRLTKEVLEELGGMGPLATLMLDSEITDILVNGPYDIWVDRNGKLSKTSVQFDDEAHLQRFLDRVVADQGRQLDARSPMVDTRLPDGSRLHAVIAPICQQGPIVSIRRFQHDGLSTQQLINSGFITQPMLDFLEVAVSSGLNIVIAGSAGAGKTSLLNTMSAYVPSSERIVTIEETSELRLKHSHVIALESRYMNSEGAGSITLRDLVKTALRMRADRIIVGEVRGAEALDMLQAMNVGHNGSLSTVHANSPHEVINRLETLCLSEDIGLNKECIKQMIYSAIQIVIQVTRFPDGTRRVVSICELDTEGKLHELFKFHPSSATEVRASGEHRATGKKSLLGERIASMGGDESALNKLLTDIQE